MRATILEGIKKRGAGRVESGSEDRGSGRSDAKPCVQIALLEKTTLIHFGLSTGRLYHVLRSHEVASDVSGNVEHEHVVS